MKNVARKAFLLLILASLSACAPESHTEVARVATTSEPPRFTVQEENGYKIARGATRVQEMTVHFDKVTKAMLLRGKLEYLPLKGAQVQSIALDLTGVLDKNGFISLKNLNSSVKEETNIKVVAKATCLSEAGDCSSSFIDIYLYKDGLVYHHQIESHQEEAEKENEKPSEVATKKDSTEDTETEGGADEAEGEPGAYVGTVHEDIENLLEVKPEPKKSEGSTPPPSSDSKEPPKGTPGKGATSAPATTDIPKTSQAIGPVNAGRLENAVNMLKYEQAHQPSGFHIMRPQRLTHFATNELSYIVNLMGQFTKQEVSSLVLSVGDLSREKGGKLGSHKSHQNGLDADVAFYFSNKSFQGYFASAVAVDKPHPSWMVEKQWELFKYVVKTKLIDRIFIHKTLKKSLCELAVSKGELSKEKTEGLAYETLRRLIPDVDHHNHFHLRVKCSSAQVRCRQMAEPAPGSGCF